MCALFEGPLFRLAERETKAEAILGPGPNTYLITNIHIGTLQKLEMAGGGGGGGVK